MAHQHKSDDDDVENRGVVVFGDHETGSQQTVLTRHAAEHGAAVIDFITFAPGAVAATTDLSELEEVVAAVGLAFRAQCDVWVPYAADLGPEQNLRRLSLVLQRHQLDLRLGQHLWRCPRKGGLNEVDLALRQEVRAVDQLDQAALAAAGIEVLNDEIEEALAVAHYGQWPDELNEVLSELKVVHGPGPAMPPPAAAWRYRQPALKGYVDWLVRECGLTQAEAAGIINTAGHRTPQGRVWQQATVSALIRGCYDSGAAA